MKDIAALLSTAYTLTEDGYFLGSRGKVLGKTGDQTMLGIVKAPENERIAAITSFFFSTNLYT